MVSVSLLRSPSLAVPNGSLRSPSLAVPNGSLRSLCCSREAAVFVGSDETIVLENQLCLEAFRRLLLQIGGANSAGRGSRLQARLLGRREQTVRRVCPLIHKIARSAAFLTCFARSSRSAARQP